MKLKTKLDHRLGQIAIDFANSSTPPEACHKHFKNMQDFLSFHPAFSAHIEEVYLGQLASIEPVDDEFKEYLESIWKEWNAKEQIKEQLKRANLVLSEIIYEAQRIKN
ncbi:MAG: hypothetical protein JW836_07930 [Deltaproteobacteria bacterium]|nr:hypothetical protein [Deltaproteobacteria bacterium]